MKKLTSYLSGQWVAGTGKPASLLNPATEEVVAETSSEGLDLKGALAHARDVGGPALRAMTFGARGEMLQKVADLIYEHRDELIECGVVNAGNTRGDAKFDVDGASATLHAYAEFAKDLPDGPWLPDGDSVEIGSKKVAGRHVFVPLEGVAVHINAFNFPAWGMMEKAACAWLAGVPVLTKPATATALMAHRLVELVVASGILPAGALSCLTGPAADLLDHVDERDMVAFTGSSDTGAWIRQIEHVRKKSVRLNVEADSLNAAVLGPDVERGSETFDLFVGDVYRDMTQKAGQKCTAIRRVFVPEASIDAVKEALIERLEGTVIGDPAVDGVRMGPIASASALKAVRAGLEKLEKDAKVAWRGEDVFKAREGFEGKGFFQAPTLLEVAADADASSVHAVEVFGPVTTLVSYTDDAAAFAAVKRGGGGLVCSIYTDDRAFLKASVQAVAVAHGRLYLGSKKMAGGAPGPGTALAPLQHGGPGRAGGGSELGGLRGVLHNMQRVALQGYGPLLDWLVK